MRAPHRLRHTLRSILLRKETETALAEEFRDHLEQEVAANVEAGMSPDAAREAAQRLLGSASLYQEECRDASGITVAENFLRDLRYAIRMLRRTPLFTAVAMLTLAIGIGATASVFTFVDNILLRSLPIPDPQRVDAINWNGISNVSYLNYVDFRDRNRSFSNLAAHRFIDANLSIQPGENLRIWGYEVTGNYFATLGIHPLIGRFFGPKEDDSEGAHPVTVIGYRFWQTHFSADPHVAGRILKINGYPFTIIGVAGASFIGSELIVAGDYWVPMAMSSEIEGGSHWTHYRTSQNASLIGRRKPFLSRAQAEADLDLIAVQLAHMYPDDVPAKGKIRLCAPGLNGAALRGAVSSVGAILMGVAALGLLLACVNLAGMLLARASDRRREVGIRLALGAGRIQIVRQLVTESLLLALSGGLLGLLFATAVCRFLSSWRPSFDIPVNIALEPNLSVLMFTAGIALLTTFLFGLSPALQATRIELIPSLKNEPISARLRLVSSRDFLVAAQIALSVLLVICSALVVRSLQYALSLKLGFNPDGAVSVSFDCGVKGYDDERIRRLNAALLAKVSHIPGIASAAIVNTLPLRMDGADTEFLWRAEQPLPKPGDRKLSFVYNASPGYLRTAGTSLLKGRDLNDHDRQNTPGVALVNATFARLLFGDENAVGRLIRISSLSEPLQIVGVVEDGKYRTLGEDPQAAIFLPLEQQPSHWNTLVARSALPSDQVTALLRQTVLSVDPELAVFSVGSLRDQLALPLFGARMTAVVLGTLGVFATTLAATGLFALMSYAVALRTREIGIRMALGAGRRQVLSSLLKRTLVLCAAGALAGTALTVAAGRVLSAVLYGLSPRDPLTYATALTVMLVVALLACAIPAGRAMHIDPIRALRED